MYVCVREREIIGGTNHQTVWRDVMNPEVNTKIMPIVDSQLIKSLSDATG